MDTDSGKVTLNREIHTGAHKTMMETTDPWAPGQTGPE